MRKFSVWMTAATAAIAMFIAGCGGSDSAFGGGGTTSSSSSGGVSTAATIVLVSDTSSIFSDGSNQATLTAYVRDTNNAFLPGAVVTFTADSGGLTITQAVTDAHGVATATLDAAGDPSSRNITVTAATNALSATAVVSVTGTTVTVSGPTTLSMGQAATYTVKVANYGHTAIQGATVTLASVGGFTTLSGTSVVTDSTGTATFTVTGAAAGAGQISAATKGVTTPYPITVTGGNTVTITAPAAGAEVTLGTSQTVTAHFISGGAPVQGRTINFSTTRGTISGGNVTATSATTNAGGDATVQITANNAGGAVITATEMTSNASTTVAMEFVATTPASLDLQPSLFTIAPSGTSTLTATVRDATGNLVKNQTVVFTLTDVTGGTLSVGSAVTNSQGSAQTVYTAGTVTSANNGVKVDAAVQSNPAVTDTVSMTVAGQQVFISLGTGNKITEYTTTQYSQDYVAQVTDSTGAAVGNVTLSLKILSKDYWKGQYAAYDGTVWPWANSTSNVPCADEDTGVGPNSVGKNNGILDPGEDFNGDGILEAGNVASIVPATAGVYTTDANGFLYFAVVYPKDHARWVDVTLTAQASVSGTEFARSTTFQLPVAATDVTDANVSPPGPISPYGTASSCSNPN